MCAILQLVSAPLNPIPIAEHFRRSHPQCEHSCEQHIYMSKENNAKQNEDVILALARALSRAQHAVSYCLLKEARKGFFGCHSVCETMKDTKEGYFIV